MDNKSMTQILGKAEVLIEALPYIQRFNRKSCVKLMHQVLSDLAPSTTAMP